MSKRDVQKAKVYAAEQILRGQLDFAAQGANLVQVFDSTIVVPLEVKFGSLEGAQRYLDQVTATDWYRAAFPKAAKTPVRLRQRRGDKWATYHWPDTIAINEQVIGQSWAMREVVVLHELAHHAHRHSPGGEHHASHSPEYAGVFLHLVAQAMGPEAGLLLQADYLDSGVKCKQIAP